MAAGGLPHASVPFNNIYPVVAGAMTHATRIVCVFERNDPFRIHLDNCCWSHDSCLRPHLPYH